MGQSELPLHVTGSHPVTPCVSIPHICKQYGVELWASRLSNVALRQMLADKGNDNDKSGA